ncbi:MAG: hypothetical protein WAT39_20455 [Planctomycetota bacterium]
MEDDIFLRPAVAGLMRKGFVEARLHTDIPKSNSAATFARNKELQQQWAGTRAMPTFVVVDPKTGRELGETPPVGLSPSALEANWIAFLQRMLAAAGRQ